ncbi:MAG TPA: non-ribosomal peptide synthetase, partial [Caldilineae bacterium]|nr:non-ribosomal peptide synthetase [Caldilineae bacterium]
GRKRLIAYIVANGNEITQMELVQFLAERLPSYMIPAAFVFMDSLPLLPNGKVDRRALPDADISRPALASDFVAPATPAEQKLADIWSELLGIEQVGVHDNFFELGGDSILSIQVVSRAQQAGLHFQAKQLFQHPTIAGLASVATEKAAIHAEQGVLTGPAPLTPIQHWFFDLGLPSPHHWNQSILLEIPAPLPPEHLRLAIDALLAHHDALRMRFHFENGAWVQRMADVDGETPVEVVGLAETPENELPGRIEQVAAQAQTSLNLQNGPLLRAVYMDLGPQRSHRLLLVLHHLVVDGVSWRILTEDLQTALAQIGNGKRILLPPKTTSFRYWAERLQDYAGSDDVAQQIDYWLSVQSAEPPSLPIDFPGGVNNEASAASVSAFLGQEDTRVLLHDIPAVFDSDVNEALLAALLRAFSKWTGSRTLLLEQEGHGREDLFEDVSLARTVGWFTSMYPLRLTLPASAEVDGKQQRASGLATNLNRSLLQQPEPAAPEADSGRVLKSVHEQVQALPQRGIGYGLLRYLHPDPAVRSRLASLPPAQISFNYLGQFDSESQSGVSTIGVAPENRGPERDHKGRRHHLLEISASIVDGELRLNWRYSRNLHRPQTIQALSDDFVAALRDLVEQGRAESEKGYATIDISGDELSYDDLDALMDEIDF